MPNAPRMTTTTRKTIQAMISDRVMNLMALQIKIAAPYTRCTFLGLNCSCQMKTAGWGGPVRRFDVKLDAALVAEAADFFAFFDLRLASRSRRGRDAADLHQFGPGLLLQHMFAVKLHHALI